MINIDIQDMKLAVDVHYEGNNASIAGIAFERWQDRQPKDIYYSKMKNINEYESGSFYKRELPCITVLLEENKLLPDTIIIDGYVFLDGHSRPGLGKVLYDSLDRKIKIIGVAKNRFSSISSEYEIFRGKSKNPLYVTSAGISISEAKEYIQQMHGDYRIPDLLKLVDQASRQPG